MAAALAQCGVCSAMPEAPVPNYPWLEGHSFDLSQRLALRSLQQFGQLRDVGGNPPGPMSLLIWHHPHAVRRTTAAGSGEALNRVRHNQSIPPTPSFGFEAN
jgi:hypothetical protein